MSLMSVMGLAGAGLVVLSVVAFAVVDKFSPTALVPAGFGLAALLCSFGGTGRHVWLSALLLAAVSATLTVPFQSASGNGDVWGLLRVGAMIAASVLSCVGIGIAQRSA